MGILSQLIVLDLLNPFTLFTFFSFAPLLLFQLFI